MEFNEAVIEKIRAKAAKTACSDDMECYEDVMTCGNADDTYGYGVEDGEILFARELLKIIEGA
jgi:hypothetical protein